MARLIIICKDKRQAKNLYERTKSYLKAYNRRKYAMDNKLIITDKENNDNVRFMTLEDCSNGKMDGLRGIRMGGNTYDRWLEDCEIKLKRRKIDDH